MSKGTPWELDVVKLSEALESARRYHGLSLRALATRLGLSPTTFTRMSQGGKPNADALATVCMYLKADLRAFTKKRETP